MEGMNGPNPLIQYGPLCIAACMGVVDERVHRFWLEVRQEGVKLKRLMALVEMEGL